MTKRTDSDKIALIKKWSDWFYERTASWEGVRSEAIVKSALKMKKKRRKMNNGLLHVSK